MRGLKHRDAAVFKLQQESHLLQMRGLKLLSMQCGRNIYVASFTDAWIETIKVKETGTAEQSHLLQMRGLKLNRECNRTRRQESHLLQMRGLKHEHEHKLQPIF